MNNIIMLTGAGFTHNFKTPLASDMASWILNHINDKELQSVIRDQNFNYENAYQTVLEGKHFTDAQKKEINEAVKRAYKEEIDDVICSEGTQFSFRGRISSIQKRLFSMVQKPFFFFTLNQDLLIEREFWDRNLSYELELPAAKCKINSGNHEDHLESFYVDNSFRDNIQEFDRLKADFEKRIRRVREGVNRRRPIIYVKLHGSMDWVSDKDNHLMIIGGNKEGRIEKFPLLKWYFEMFKEEVNKPDTKLLVIGYGFSDEHINRVIINAINNYNLEIYVINPTERGCFETSLTEKEDGITLLNAIKKYYQCKLSEVFANTQYNELLPCWRTIAYDMNIHVIP